jgi:hypothetical protein
VSYDVVVSELRWRMPAAGEPAARLLDVTVAEVAEALEAPPHLQLRQRIDHDVLAVYSVTADRRAIGVLLVRNDDSFVWRVARAKPLSAVEFEIWLGRIQQ